MQAAPAAECMTGWLQSAHQVCCCKATLSLECLRWQEDISEEALTSRMRRLLEPFLLRRLKEQVASQLVPKQQQVCPGSCTKRCTSADDQQEQDNLA